MDEGRPTKAKWWSRPRQESPGTTQQPPSAEAEQPAAGHTGAFAQGPAPQQTAAPQPSGPQAEQRPAVPAQSTPATGTALPAEAAPPPQAERPRPLHDPDPYSTPPYGEPGPWAPAPPVQHPAATPAHGTTLPATSPTGTPPHGTPGQPPMQAGTPPHGTPGQPPMQAGTPPHGTPGHASTQSGTPAPAPTYGGTPPHGTPGQAPMPGGTPAPAPTYGGTPPHGTPAPAPMHGTTPPPPGGTTPAPYGSAPRAQAPQHAEAPAPPHAQAPQHPQAPTPHGQAPAPHAQALAASHAPQPQIAHGVPRQAYDPWNQPLQQIGSLPPETREGQRRRGRRLLVLGVALIALVSGLIGGALGSYLERNGVDEVELPQTGAESADRPKGSVAGIAAAALPGVVTLHVSGDSAQGTGTGFVLDRKGHILTNNHVVEPAGTGGEISVTFSGGDTAEAKVIGRDSGYDLAVVKVSNVRGLKPLPLGNSENVQVGDPVVAIGAPFDLANTVTSGIISAKERPITAGGEKGDGSDVSYVDALQTDAPINPGNSGGPLVDAKARVIGINSAIRSAGDGSDMKGGQAGSIGLGFAIPINQGKRVAEELINFGKATHPVIGVTLDTRFTGDGARIADKGKDGGPAVNAGGPGDKAGLKPGDVITEVDGAPVHSSDELIVKVRAHRPKDRLDLTIERGGQDREVTLVLGSADGD
ncbi:MULTISPECIES: S1C family serine protease [Streptomyces]|uniref:S1C family serine protease n=1 Tax=Streptomyces TaxID=1883 RepID=UPI001E520797|nr:MULTISPECIES: trypsin-like peptidase domain-containing protein [Streptomyces]UFQ17876.1 trypsin-like peptidase domain-containing protein [Streptomyces huasconensis]WCL87482.1 trypsin-like peptidase domain-containing protein [Streptomyces sp. JCM 35825]